MHDHCIICITPAFASAAILQKHLDCPIAAQKPDPKGFYKHCTQPLLNFDSIPQAKHYIFAGSGVLLRLDVDRLPGRKSVIISDSHYLSDTARIDEIIEKNRIEVSCMIDLWAFCKHKKRAFVQPYDPIDFEIKKNKQITICHSPSLKYDSNLKGSREIARVVDQIYFEFNKIDYLCLTSSPWQEAIKQKSKSHIVIDQLVIGQHPNSKDYRGGLGKSGLEGMLTGCLTVSSGRRIETDIPAPPYIVANSETELYSQIKRFITNQHFFEDTVKIQTEWAKKYTHPENVIDRLLAPHK